MLDTKMPALFVPHGAPDLALQDNEAASFLKNLGTHISRKPKAIIMVSAHWETRGLQVTAARELETIYDFRGFAKELYELKYPAQSSSSLIENLLGLLASNGHPLRLHAGRGLDHGAWVPLMLAFPEADIPLVQLSLDKSMSPEDLFNLGKVLASLSEQGILVIASGGLVHNLFELDFANPNEPHEATQPWAREFESWLDKHVEAKDWQSLFNYRSLAPNAERAHPTDEHLRPLFITLGVNEALDLSPKKLHSSFTYGNISMAAWG